MGNKSKKRGKQEKKEGKTRVKREEKMSKKQFCKNFRNEHALVRSMLQNEWRLLECAKQ